MSVQAADDANQSNIRSSLDGNNPNEVEAVKALQKIFPYLECTVAYGSKKFVSALWLGSSSLKQHDEVSMPDLPESEQENMCNEEPLYEQLLPTSASELARANMRAFQVVWNLKRIQRLQLWSIPLQSIPDQIKNLKNSLKHLNIRECYQLLRIYSGIGMLENLQTLTIRSCNQLRSLPSAIGDLRSLKTLEITKNYRLEMLPPEIGHLENLEVLKIDDNHLLATLPPEIGRLKNLISLNIYSCSSLTSLPGEIGQLRKLERMDLCNLPRLQSLPNEFLQFLHALQRLSLERCTALTNLDNVSLDGLQNLTGLEVKCCDQLESLPVAIQQIPKLKRLVLSMMPRQAILAFFGEPWAGITGPEDIYILGTNSYARDGRSTVVRRLWKEYASILPGLPPLLRSIDLTNQWIENLNGFLERGIPSRLMRLGLTGSPIRRSSSQEDRDCLYKLLETYPNLGSLGIDADSELFTRDSLYLLYLNRCGRVLLGNDKPIPLSVWPLVFERIKKCICKRDSAKASMEASVLFTLLRGPALLHRSDGFKTCNVARKRKFVP